MTGTLFSFSTMAIGGRELSTDLSVVQLLFYRSLIGLLLAAFLLISFGQVKGILRVRLPAQISRNSFHLIGQYGWFLGISLLPLAQVFALEFTVPLWTLIIAVLFLGERITASKVMSIMLGLGGVVVILRPGMAGYEWSSLIVLLAAIAYACSHSLTKAMAHTHHPAVIVFFMCLIQLPITFCIALFDWGTPQSSKNWWWLLLVAASALSAHFCMSKAMQFAEASSVVAMDFLRLPLIAVLGFLFYQEEVDIWVFAGAGVMLTGNVIGLKAQRLHPIKGTAS